MCMYAGSYACFQLAKHLMKMGGGLERCQPGYLDGAIGCLSLALEVDKHDLVSAEELLICLRVRFKRDNHVPDLDRSIELSRQGCAGARRGAFSFAGNLASGLMLKGDSGIQPKLSYEEGLEVAQAWMQRLGSSDPHYAAFDTVAWNIGNRLVSLSQNE